MRLSELQLGSRSASNKGRNAALLVLLRRIAQVARGDHARPFYSIREVARRFHFSPTTVSRIFGQLKTEGLLAALWGSNTRLEAIGLDRQLHLRGLVAELVPVAAFADKRECRDLVARVCDELWKLRFASRLWVYDDAENDRAILFQTVIAAKPAAIISIMPNECTRALVHRFTNHGIRVIHIADKNLVSKQIRALQQIVILSAIIAVT